MTQLAPLLLIPFLLPAQDAAPVLENKGPMQVPYRCTQEDMDWAGLTCTEEEPCPVYLELSAVEGMGTKIFAAGNIHTSNTTLYSILLASDDGGKTWREVHERIRGAALDRIQFLDFEHGWISGGVVFPLAQDPFFLITNDGGKTWRRRPISGETRPGSIQQFWFSSRTSGAMVIDRGAAGETGRYELYESPNGGDSWMIRQTNERPIDLKRALPPAPHWRIQPDGKTRSFRIERLGANDKWALTAAFLVAMSGGCPAKPVSVPASPPP